MANELYKGYELHIGNVVDNPNGQRTQTVLIYKGNNCIGATFADIQYENAIDKAKIKIDKISVIKT